MSAVPENIVAFQLPKKPRVKQKDAPPDQRKVVVLPIKAVFDQQLTHGALQVLAAVCAYCNRAGITWVSQTRLASELGISQQAVAKQFKQLRERGYLETVRKGFKGERTDTLRVIFDKSVDADTAIAITSAQEDTRPPYMREQQADQQGQQRVANLISKALNQPPTRSTPMANPSQSKAVQQMHKDIAKAKSKRSPKTPSNHNPEVVNVVASQSQPQPVDNSVQLQPNHNLEVVNNTENTVLRRYLSKDMFVQLKGFGMNEEMIFDNLGVLLQAYEAEGMTPNPDRLVEEILHLSKVGT